MKHPVIARKHLPVSIPLFPTLTIWLVLDRLQASGVVQAIVWTLWAALFLLLFISVINETHVHPQDLP